ncbi:hypothetical protein A6R68_08392 [Neotoma lepida]|uniref:Uncharacterized protein n=1 Tax=Neotoma lepida TaxID=56216 RepID=A0A1A6G2Q4_NEOLE|nr:hypothetical protein A6R68_08392 [Neotoma lepida]
MKALRDTQGAVRANSRRAEATWGLAGGTAASSTDLMIPGGLGEAEGPTVKKLAARLVSMELMSPTAMLLMPAGMEGSVREFRGYPCRVLSSKVPPVWALMYCTTSSGSTSSSSTSPRSDSSPAPSTPAAMASIITFSLMLGGLGE